MKALFTSVPDSEVLNAFADPPVHLRHARRAVLRQRDSEDDCDEAGTCPDELYGSFSRAFFTMFQTSTLRVHAWSDVSRSLMCTTGQAALVATLFN
jgi:hypothetical protein